MKNKAVVLWSGGKDCNLALLLAKEKGFEITALVTFHSAATEFRAHPKEWMELQAKSLGIPHLFLEIKEPFTENYEAQLSKLRSQLDVNTVVSGDISEVHGNSNWISERALAVGMEVFLPLWHAHRKEVLQQLLDAKFEVMLTMVKAPWFDGQFVGREINPALISEFEKLQIEKNLDICGENGEYHTMVVNGPGYRSPITVSDANIIQFEEMYHFNDLQLKLNADFETPVLEKHKLCVTCGIPFSCYTHGCWCSELPMIMPMENITDCLCPTCLKAEINKKLVENNHEPLV